MVINGISNSIYIIYYILYFVGVIGTITFTFFKDKFLLIVPIIYSLVIFLILQDGLLYRLVVEQIVFSLIFVLARYIILKLIRRRNSNKLNLTKIKDL